MPAGLEAGAQNWAVAWPVLTLVAKSGLPETNLVQVEAYWTDAQEVELTVLRPAENGPLERR